MKFLEPHFKIGDYLHRWFLTPWSRDDHPLKVKRLPNIYLHKIMRSDDDRALHDHPWNNLSIILKGGYIEHVFARPAVEGLELPPVVQKRRRAGSIVFRRAEEAHRLELYRKIHWDGVTQDYEIPCWSIFITWRKRREWGFWCTRVRSFAVTAYEWGKENITELHYIGPVAKWIHQAVFDAFGGCEL